jgi:hypothetical protein
MTRQSIERQIIDRIRELYAGGWVSDALVEDTIAAAIGDEHRPLIRRIHADEFKSFPP